MHFTKLFGKTKPFAANRKLAAAREAEYPLGENVAQHLGRSRLDRVRAGAQELVLPAVAISDLSRRPRHVNGGLRHLLVELRPHELED